MKANQPLYLNAPCLDCGKDNAMRIKRIDGTPYWYCVHCEQTKLKRLKMEEIERIKRIRKHERKIVLRYEEKQANKYRLEYCPQCGKKHDDKEYYGHICAWCMIELESREENI